MTERRQLTIRPAVPERRAMAFTRTRSGLCIANLHARNDRPDLASEEVLHAAAVAAEWSGEAPLLFGGDLNLRPAEHPEVFDELPDPDAVFASGLCTKTHADRLHSYRAAREGAGRLLAAIRVR